MVEIKSPRILRIILFLITFLSLSFSAYAKYSRGTGEPNDPYQIATAEDLILLGESPEDYDKHFILTADIDLDPNLPGRRIFDKAVIAPDVNDAIPSWSDSFTGVFDGNGHVISHLIIEGENYLGLFGRIGYGAKVMDLGVVDVRITGSGSYIGGLVGKNGYSWYITNFLTNCYSTGMVSGNNRVGGLVGSNKGGSIISSYSTGTTSGQSSVGGLVGWNENGEITNCYSTNVVKGNSNAGGLLGFNYYADVTGCYSTGSVSGSEDIGGLVGENFCGNVTQCYSTGFVTGDEFVGGLVGVCFYGDINLCFWDIETSGQVKNAGGMGKTTAQMQTSLTFLNWGTCNANGTWTIDEGNDYPRLWWENRTGEPIALGETLSDLLAGYGTESTPYLIYTADELNLIGLYTCDFDKHFRLMADIDLSDFTYDAGLIAPNTDNFRGGFLEIPFAGVFDGNGHTISNLTIEGKSNLGLFVVLTSSAEVKDLALVNVKITGSGNYIGGLVAQNSGTVTNCCCTGTVTGIDKVGGLVGYNSKGRIITSYSTVSVNGDDYVGGFVGWNNGNITASYSTSLVIGDTEVGGLVGKNNGYVTNCYSTNTVKGNGKVGGLVGTGAFTRVQKSVWDMETTGLFVSAGGMGLTSYEMMDQYILGLNGFANDPNWVVDTGLDYPKLAWEGTAGQIVPEPEIDWLEGQGTQENPYQIHLADQLILISRGNILWDRCFILSADIDLDPNLPDRKIFTQPIIQIFSGVFNGNGNKISHMKIEGISYLGLFGRLAAGAEVMDLGVVDVNINGTDGYIGGLVAYNSGAVTNCYSNGSVSGSDKVGGLVGYNSTGSITTSYSNGTVSGKNNIGGLAGNNSSGSVTTSFSTCLVTGDEFVGGLLGSSYGDVTDCFSTSSVHGSLRVGGIVGENGGNLRTSFSAGIITGTDLVGGLVGVNTGYNYGYLSPIPVRTAVIADCYSRSMVSGGRQIGGAVGLNGETGPAEVWNCYSTGSVIGNEFSGGLVGYNDEEEGTIRDSFWNIVISGQTISDGGMGLTTVELQTASTFLEAGWDFMDETTNGTENIWWINEGQDYPRLWWELIPEN